MKRKIGKITFIASFILLMSASVSYGQKWGVGLKLGDPLGLSVKKYMDKNKALELVFGRSYYRGGYDYDYYYKHDNRFKNKHGYWYAGHYDHSTPIAVQLRYLIHKDIKSADGLQWYYGVGLQFRHQSFSFRYYDDFYDDIRTEKVHDWGIGPDGIIGLEYTFKEVPISLGADINLYMEIMDRPFMFLFQGGVAARYNF